MTVRFASWSVVAVALVAAGCGTGVLPGDAGMPAGSRELIIRVDNTSNARALLAVRDASVEAGESVGSVGPAIVDPLTRQLVTFRVPSGDGWAIFVEPWVVTGPDVPAQDPPGGFILDAADIPPDASGRLPIAIVIGPDGDLSVTIEGIEIPGRIRR